MCLEATLQTFQVLGPSEHGTILQCCNVIIVHAPVSQVGLEGISPWKKKVNFYPVINQGVNRCLNIAVSATREWIIKITINQFVYKETTDPHSIPEPYSIKANDWRFPGKA